MSDNASDISASASTTSAVLTGFGPVTPDHLPPFARRMRAAADRIWEDGYRQPFLTELAAGTLPQKKFAFYLMQDNRYLFDYAKVHALGFAKTEDPDIRAYLAQACVAIARDEPEMQRRYLESFGISAEEAAGVKQTVFARAYTTNMLTVAHEKPIVDILVALLPCAWVYADYGRRLAADYADKLETNPYRSWIDMYSPKSFWDAGAGPLIAFIERLAADESEERLAELTDLFVTGVGNEYMFWASAYGMQRSWRAEWDEA